MQKLLRCSTRLIAPRAVVAPAGIYPILFNIILGMRTVASAKSLDPSTYGPQTDEHGEPRFLEQVELFFKRAAKLTDVPADILEVIKQCNSVIRFHIPLKMDDGTIKNVTCYR